MPTITLSIRRRGGSSRQCTGHANALYDHAKLTLPEISVPPRSVLLGQPSFGGGRRGDMRGAAALRGNMPVGLAPSCHPVGRGRRRSKGEPDTLLYIFAKCEPRASPRITPSSIGACDQAKLQRWAKYNCAQPPYLYREATLISKAGRLRPLHAIKVERIPGFPA